jgi:alpha/beta superfamily hydrolase
MNAETPVTIEGGGPRLEGMLRDGDADIAAVVLHPHPQYGGDMHNHVVAAVCGALAAEGATTLRFNFRGTGRSEGEYEGGAGEADDARAAVAFVCERQPGRRVVLAGYSFGAAIALGVAEGLGLAGLVLVSLPGQMASRALPEGLPALIVTGGRDPIAPPEALRALDSPGREVIVVPGADHGWFPGAELLVGHVREFVRNLPNGR